MLGNIPGNRDCAIRNTCVRLFEQYTGDELQKKIAEHTADDWLHHYKHKVFKGAEPAEAKAYRSMKQEDRDAYDKNNKDWHKSEKMLEWARGEEKVVAENESNRHFLEEMLPYLSGDAVREGKVREVLAGHPNAKVKVGSPSVSWVD